jgi:hypothetical protein
VHEPTLFDHYNEDPKNNVPTANFHTADAAPFGGVAFPNHFTLYVLSAKSTTGAGSWNSGENSGIAISTSTNEVVYWAGTW